MLVYDSRLLKVTRLNEIIAPVFDADDIEHTDMPVGYLYCDLATYQQVVTLNVRFEGDVMSLTSLLLATVKNREQIDYWAKVVPSPFNMLAPYIGLISEKVELENDIQSLSKYLHIIGKSINFSDFVAIPMAARINVMFSKSSFLMADEEIRDYKRTLRAREKDEYPDDVLWVSSEEVGRVLTMAKEILENMPGVSLQTTASSSTSETVSNGELDTEIDEEDDWSGYVPPAPPSMDWGGAEKSMVDAAIETVNSKAEKSEDGTDAGIDLMEKLMSGVINSHNV